MLMVNDNESNLDTKNHFKNGFISEYAFNYTMKFLKVIWLVYTV